MGSWCSRRQPNPSASVDVDTISMSSVKTTPHLSSPQAPAQGISPSQGIFPPPLPPPRQSDSGHISLPPQAHHVKSSTPPPLPPPRQAAKYKSSALPATTDATAAVAAFRSQREGLLQLIRNCLSSLANALYAQFLIPEDARERATNESVGTSERSVALLNCMEARSKALPADFIKIVQILESDQYLETMASELVHSYLTASQLAKSQLTNTSPPISAVISHYSSYLKALYKQSPISPVNKWPPTPSKEYVQLALVQERDRCRDEYIGHVLEGNIKQILRFRKECSIDQILDTTHTFKKFVNTGKRLILIEGAPGIGKSTFAWELCRKWEELECMQNFCLVVLLRLRERKVQKITEISDLFKSCGATDYKSVSKEVSQNHGSGVLFVLDGFDELPQSLQHEGFLMDLITKTVLPESTVVVTSRPSATAELLTGCRPLIWKRIEILGFTQESVEAYAATIFSDPSELERFKNYISASNNPAINSLMYVPINAAIIVQIFSESKSRSTLPLTLTSLYTQLCLTLLNKYIKSEHHSSSIRKFEDLPEDLYKEFSQLSRIAFEGIANNQLTFYDVNLQHDFGFLDSASSLYGGGEISYNFLHLTLQEFFAAYHISQFPDHGVQLFLNKECEGGHWNVVWRFVAGLTKFVMLKNPSCAHSNIWYDVEASSFTKFLFQCLFEADVALDCDSVFGTKVSKNFVNAENDRWLYTPFDMFCLGYCLRNCTKEASSWSIKCGYSHEFILGLNTVRLTAAEHGAIQSLCIQHSLYTIGAKKFFELMLRCSLLKTVVNLFIEDDNLYTYTLTHLEQAILCLNCLKKLHISSSSSIGYVEIDKEKSLTNLEKFLKLLSHSSVTSLSVRGSEIEHFLKENSCVVTAFDNLLDPSLGTLKELIVDGMWDNNYCGEFLRLVSKPTSLHHLTISIISNIGYGTIGCSFMVEDIVSAIKGSQQLKGMHLSSFNTAIDSDLLNAIVIVTALQTNKNMHTLHLSWRVPEDSKIEKYEELNAMLSGIDARVNIVLQEQQDPNHCL